MSAHEVARIQAETTRRLERMWQRRDRRGLSALLRGILAQLYDQSTGGIHPGAVPPLAGDVTGPIRANVVSELRGTPVGAAAPEMGQSLVFDGASWAPATLGGGGGIAGHTIQDEGISLAQRASLNFTGTGVTATDAGGKTVVTIPGGGGSGGAPTSATYVVRTADATLTNEVLLADVMASELETRFEPLTNGDAAFPELLYMDGDVLMMEVVA